MSTVPACLQLPHERRARCVRRLWLVLMFMVGLLAATLLDPWVWRACTLPREVFERVERRDWYQLLRQAGYLPLWVCVGLAVWCVDRRVRRGGLIVLAAGLGGAAAEVLKLIVQRYRPGSDGAYAFRWMMDGVPGGELVKGLGLASSHAGVAFGGALMVFALWPRAGWVVIPLAAGCAATRLVSGAHFLSDVYVGAAMSYGVVLGLIALDGRVGRRADGPR